MVIKEAIKTIDPKIEQSLSYLFKSDQLLPTVFMGSLSMYFLFLFLSLFSIASEFDAGILVRLISGAGILIFNSILIWYYIRILDRLADGNESPPRFDDIPRMLLNGLITNIALIVPSFTIGFVIGFVIVLLSGLSSGVFPTYVYFIIPQVIIIFLITFMTPATMIAMSQIEKEITVRSYPRFIIRYLSELRSITTERNYLYGWLLVIIAYVVQFGVTGSPLVKSQESARNLYQWVLGPTNGMNISSVLQNSLQLLIAAASVFYLMTIVYYIFGKVMEDYVRVIE